MKPSASGTIRQLAPVAGAVLLCRLLLEIWPVSAVSPSQTALLDWPAFLLIVVLAFPAVHYAQRWGATLKAPARTLALNVNLRALAAGALLALLLIGWDVLFRLPRDMNVLGLRAIPFYISGAFVVEVVQHTMPLALWLGIAGRLLLRGRYARGVFWGGALLVAALEPLSQLGGPMLAGYSATFYVVGAVVSYGINLAQLFAFRRYGFVAMLAVRLGLYALWHVIWGPLRLQILF